MATLREELKKLKKTIKKGEAYLYEEWYDDNEADLRIYCAETGMDMEIDFDFDDYCESQYFKYVAV